MGPGDLHRPLLSCDAMGQDLCDGDVDVGKKVGCHNTLGLGSSQRGTPLNCLCGSNAAPIQIQFLDLG